MAFSRAGPTTAFLVVGLVLFACSPTPTARVAPPADDDAITVGSFDFAESELLGEIYSQALEADGYRVHRAFSLGPREFVVPALSQGLVGLVPEYAGTALQFFSLGTTSPSADVTDTHAALVGVLDGGPLQALAPAPAQDANAFVVTRETAAREGLRTLSDVAAVAPELTFGGPAECPTRPLCLLGLEERYGLQFGDFLRLDAGGPITRRALADGDVDIALLFTTDPALGHDDLVELVDDRGLQPAENVTPVIRTQLVERWGHDVVALLDGVSRCLTTSELRRLNGELGDGGEASEIVAAWLAAECRA